MNTMTGGNCSFKVVFVHLGQKKGQIRIPIKISTYLCTVKPI